MRGIGCMGLGIVLALSYGSALGAQEIRVGATILPVVDVAVLDMVWEVQSSGDRVCSRAQGPSGIRIEIEREDGTRAAVQPCASVGSGTVRPRGEQRAHEPGGPSEERIVVWVMANS